MELASHLQSASPDLFKIVTLNVASLRACFKKGLPQYFDASKADIYCIQETKVYNDPAIDLNEFKIEGYEVYFSHAAKKGYSGTAIYTRIKPEAVYASFPDNDGRCITMEFKNFCLVNTYVVNAGSKLEKLQYKIETWLPKIKAHIDTLSKEKPVIWTGDLNVAHKDIDIYEPKGHNKTAGFTPEERRWFDEFLNSGYTDVFRHLYPDKQEFTFFSYLGNARAKGRGWRLDYFVVPSGKEESMGIVDCVIESSHTFSDHNPCVLILDKSKILGESYLQVAETKITCI